MKFRSLKIILIFLFILAQPILTFADGQEWIFNEDENGVFYAWKITKYQGLTENIKKVLESDNIVKSFESGILFKTIKYGSDNEEKTVKVAFIKNPVYFKCLNINIWEDIGIIASSPHLIKVKIIPEDYIKHNYNIFH